MIDTDKYEEQLEDDNTDTWVVWQIAKESLAEVKRLRGALAYTASLLTCRIEGDDIPVTDIREYALDVVDMTVNEALATTDLMGDEEE